MRPLKRKKAMYCVFVTGCKTNCIGGKVKA